MNETIDQCRKACGIIDLQVFILVRSYEEDSSSL